MPKLAAALEFFLLLTFLARVVAPTEIEPLLEDELEPEAQADIEAEEEDELDPVADPDTSLVVVVVVLRSMLPDLVVV